MCLNITAVLAVQYQAKYAWWLCYTVVCNVRWPFVEVRSFSVNALMFGKFSMNVYVHACRYYF